VSILSYFFLGLILSEISICSCILEIVILIVGNRHFFFFLPSCVELRSFTISFIMCILNEYALMFFKYLNEKDVTSLSSLFFFSFVFVNLKSTFVSTSIC
jgi:hypothetical protein